MLRTCGAAHTKRRNPDKVGMQEYSIIMYLHSSGGGA